MKQNSTPRWADVNPNIPPLTSARATAIQRSARMIEKIEEFTDDLWIGYNGSEFVVIDIARGNMFKAVTYREARCIIASLLPK